MNESPLTLDLTKSHLPSDFQSKIREMEEMSKSSRGPIHLTVNPSGEKGLNVPLFSETTSKLLITRIDPAERKLEYRDPYIDNYLTLKRYAAFAPLSQNSSELFVLNTDSFGAELAFEHLAAFAIPKDEWLTYAKDSLAELTNEILGNLLKTSGMTRHDFACPITIEAEGTQIAVEGGKWLIRNIGKNSSSFIVAISTR